MKLFETKSAECKGLNLLCLNFLDYVCYIYTSIYMICCIRTLLLNVTLSVN